MLQCQIQDGRYKLHVFCNFRPLDYIFLYANVTQMLWSYQNAFFWYMLQAYVHSTSETNNQNGRHVDGVITGFLHFSPLDNIFLYANGTPML